MKEAEETKNSLSLLPHHVQKLLNEHGLNAETIKKSGLYSATAKELNRILGRGDITSDGIVIPYDAGYSRARLDVPLILRNEKKAKYLSPSGSENRLYIPKAVKLLLEYLSSPIYITEGEFKALKLTQEGFPCIGIPGVWGFSREKKLLPDFNEINFKGRKVTIILDSDARRKVYEEN